MIDYLFAAPDQATAQADPALSAFWLPANPPFTPGGAGAAIASTPACKYGPKLKTRRRRLPTP